MREVVTLAGVGQIVCFFEACVGCAQGACMQTMAGDKLQCGQCRLLHMQARNVDCAAVSRLGDGVDRIRGVDHV